MVHSDAVVALGVLFGVGLLADFIGRRTRVPRVTLLLCCGLIAGSSGFLPDTLEGLTETITVTALTFVAFLLGGSLQRSRLNAHGVEIMLISISVVLATLVVVTTGLTLAGVGWPLALILAGIATATDPAATLDVIRQSRVQNSFTRVLEGIVAIDDAWGLLVFSLCLSAATKVAGTGAMVHVSAFQDIAGAVLLGVAVGAPAAFLSGRIRGGEPLLTEALSIVFLTAGLASWLQVSFLIAGMVAGTIIVNFATHHRRAFHEIEHIHWPFMILFFLLAGASLDLSAVVEIGALGIAFILLRIAARILGGWIGGQLSGVARGLRPLFGPALLPQAGVAVGMALLAGQVLPQWRDQIMVVTLGATVAFEIMGPFFTMWSVRKSVPAAKRFTLITTHSRAASFTCPAKGFGTALSTITEPCCC